MRWFLPFFTIIHLVHCNGADNAKCSNVTSSMCSSHKKDLCIKINEGTNRGSLRLVSNCKLQQLLCLGFTANLIPVEECPRAQKKLNVLRKKIKPRRPAQSRSGSSDLSPKKRGHSKKHKRPSKIRQPKNSGRHGASHPRPTTRRPKTTKQMHLELWGRPAGHGKRPHPTIFERARLDDESLINDRKPKSENPSKPRKSTKPGHSKDGGFKKLGRTSKLKRPQDFGRSGVSKATSKQKGLGLWGRPAGRGKRPHPTMRATLGHESGVPGMRPHSVTPRHPRKLKFVNSSKSELRMKPGCSTDASFKKLGRPEMLQPLKMPKSPGVTRPHKKYKLNLWVKPGGRGRRPKPTIFRRARLDEESLIGSPRSGSSELGPFKEDKGKPGRLPRRVLERYATLDGRRRAPPPKRPWPWRTPYSEPTRPTEGKLQNNDHPTYRCTSPTETTTRSTTCTWPKSNIKRLTNKNTSPKESVTRPTYRCTSPTESVKRLYNKNTSPTETVTRPTYRCTSPTETVTRPTYRCTSPTETVTRPTYRCTSPTETVTRPTYRCTSPTETNSSDLQMHVAYGVY